MTQHIDIPRFIEFTGELDFLAVVSEAFLRSLPLWRADFCQATEAYEIDALANLLHKMKGSCYAVAAHGAAAQFELAEHDISNTNQDTWRRQSSILLDLIEQIEIELRAIIMATNRDSENGQGNQCRA